MKTWIFRVWPICLAFLSGCIPTTPGTTIPFPDTPVTQEDIFTLLFIGDSEPRMRDNTDDELKYYVNKLIELKSTKVLYFDLDGGNTHRILPEIVLLGGDISQDRGTSIAKDSAIWFPLFQNGILFLAAFGNHDWDPEFFSDGPGYSVAGHQSNENTKAFCTWTYKRSAALSPYFKYKNIEHVVAMTGVTSGGPRNFYATYKGVSIVNFNTFLYQPSYYYPAGWPLNCNLAAGGAGCQKFVSAATQILRMESVLPNDTGRVVLFFEHYPLTTSSSWWSDYGASGTSVQQKQDTLKSIITRYPKAAFFAGHNHSASVNTYTYSGRSFTEYVAPYFGGWNGDDRSQGGGFLAVLVSSTRGVLEVKRIDPPL